jgi:polyisoprenoid-binding protein YceI
MPRWLVATAMLACMAAAGAADFRVERTGSSVTFKALQQGARFPGSFERFGGTVSFDPATLAGRIDASVELASVDSGNPERDDVLRTADWFDPARYPAARFVADRFRRTGDGFAADGVLALRDIRRPATLAFRFTPPGSDGLARLSGELAVKRLDFGIGQGEWTDTQYVGNDVDVTIDVRLRPVAAGETTSATSNGATPR